MGSKVRALRTSRTHACARAPEARMTREPSSAPAPPLAQWGDTALASAKEKGHGAVVKLLEDAAAAKEAAAAAAAGSSPAAAGAGAPP